MFKQTLVAFALVSSLSLQCFFPCTTMAQSVLYNSLAESADAAYGGGRYRDAETLLQRLREVAINGGLKGIYLTRPSLKLADTYRILGKLTQAEKLLTETLTLTEQQLGSDHEDVSLILSDLASVAQEQGHFLEADQLLRTALANGEKKPGKDNAVLNAVLNRQLGLYIAEGKFQNAQQVLQRIKSELENAGKQKTFDYAYALYMGGYLTETKGKFEEASAIYEQALALTALSLGKQHPTYGELLTTTATAYRAASNYSRAEAVLKEGLAILQGTGQGDHPNIAKALMLLSDVYCDEGKYTLAEEFGKKSLEMSQRVLGDEAPDTASSKGSLSRVYRYQAKYKEAETLCRQSIEVLTKIGGPHFFALANGFNELGQILEDEGRLEEAENIFKQSMAIVQENLGVDHPDMAEITHSLAHLYLQEKRFTDAEPLLKQSLQASIKLLGKDQSAVSTNFHDLAELYLNEKKLSDSETNLREALAIDEKIFGASSARVAADLELLTRILQAQNKTDAARQSSDRVSSIEKNLPGSRYLRKADTADSLLSTPDRKQAVRPVADKWALLVGISNFKDPSIDLKYAAKDATDFKNFLIKEEHFKPDHVLLLTDQAATREQIVSKLGDGWLGKLAKPDDLVVIYVSSHGSSSRDEVGVNFLVAHDTTKNSLLATGIPMQWLTKIVKEEVHSDRTVLILDVCHSAAAADDANPKPTAKSAGGTDLDGGKDLTYKRQPREDGINPDNLNLGAGQIVLCSSLADQISWESKNYSNSVFTRRLIEALRTKGDETSLHDAYQYLKTTVQSEVLRDRGELQTPLLAAKNWTGGDPVLSAQPANPHAVSRSN